MADFQRNILGDSINFNNLCCNPVVIKKKLETPVKKMFFWPNFHKKGVIMGHGQNEKLFDFLTEITKAGHYLSETFDFIEISYVLIEL